MSKKEKCTCKACKNTVFHCQICKFVGFLLPSSWQTTNFTFFTMVLFSSVFKKTISCYKRNDATLDDTLHKEKAGKKHKTDLVKRLLSNFPANEFPACVTAPQTTTNVHFESSFSDRNLSDIAPTTFINSARPRTTMEAIAHAYKVILSRMPSIFL